MVRSIGKLSLRAFQVRITLSGLIRLALLSAMLGFGVTQTNAQDQCAADPNAAGCKPAASDAESASPPQPNWTVTTERSPFTRLETILVTTPSKQSVEGLFGDQSPVKLTIRCAQNTTSVFFDFGENFMSDVADYGVVSYRIDNRFPASRRLTASDDNSSLGLFAGAAAIPFARDFFGGSSLLVQAKSFENQVYDLEFDIAGIEQAITPLRNACNW